MNVCTKLNNNPSKGWDISLKTTTFDIMVAPVEKRGDHKSRIHPLGTMNICTNRMPIHPIDVYLIDWGIKSLEFVAHNHQGMFYLHILTFDPCIHCLICASLFDNQHRSTGLRTLWKPTKILLKQPDLCVYISFFKGWTCLSTLIITWIIFTSIHHLLFSLLCSSSGEIPQSWPALLTLYSLITRPC